MRLAAKIYLIAHGIVTIIVGAYLFSTFDSLIDFIHIAINMNGMDHLENYRDLAVAALIVIYLLCAPFFVWWYLRRR